MSDENAWDMWNLGPTPNKYDYEGMPDWYNRKQRKKVQARAAEKGAAARRQMRTEVTLPKAPWEVED